MSIKRVSPSPQLETFLMAARKVADALNLRVLILLSEIPYDFSKIQNELRKLKLIVASDRPEILQAAKDDGVDLITLLHEQTSRPRPAPASRPARGTRSGAPRPARSTRAAPVTTALGRPPTRSACAPSAT